MYAMVCGPHTSAVTEVNQRAGYKNKQLGPTPQEC